MAKSADNGILWALGAVGALALGSMVASRAGSGSSSQMGSFAKGAHTCVTCGRGVHLVSGSRDVAEPVEEQEISSRGSFLLRNRGDAKNGFALPLKDCDALEAYFNRPVTGFKAAHMEKMQLLLLSGVDAPRVRSVLDAQVNTLYGTYGVGKLVDAEEKGAPPTLSPSMDAYAYADEKAKGRMQRVRRKIKAGTGFVTGTLGLDLILQMGGVKSRLKGSMDRSTAKSRAPTKVQSPLEDALFDMFVRHYVVELYLNRAWTLHLLEKYGLTRDRRRSVYRAQTDPKDSLRLFDDITFRLAKIETRPPTERQEAVQARRKKELAEDLEELPTDIAQDVIVDGTGIPELLMSDERGAPCAVFFISEGGTQYFRYGKQRIILITKTSKMSSPSFGLPAGTGKEGGTCPGRAIAQSFRRTRLQKGKPVSQKLEAICDVCYAMGANYGYANNMIDQEGRARWIKNLLITGRDPITKTSDALTQMVSDYAMYGAHGGREGQEIGVWRSDARDGTKKGAITYRSGKDRLMCRNTDLRIELPGMKGVATTRDFFRESGVENGQVCGFFRIHDSGDFGLAPSPTYMAAWRQVFINLPHVRFWAPVRVWAAFSSTPNPEQRAWNERFMSRPSPAVIRQQALKHPIVFRQGSGNRHGSRSLDAASEEPSAAPSLASPGEMAARGNDFVKDTSCNKLVVENAQILPTVKKMSAPDNAAIRPSDLYIHASDGSGSNIPYIEGLAAGSGVAKSAGEGKYPPVYDMRGREAYQCPVYTKEKQVNSDGTVSYREAKSCQAANCRACWIAKDLPIFYGAH